MENKKMVPLNEAIDDGLWLTAVFIADDGIEREIAEEITFQVKPLSLQKSTLPRKLMNLSTWSRLILIQTYGCLKLMLLICAERK